MTPLGESCEGYVVSPLFNELLLLFGRLVVGLGLGKMGLVVRMEHMGWATLGF